MRSSRMSAALVLASVLTTASFADDQPLEAKADLKLIDGTLAGTASLTPSPSGVLIKIKLSGLPPGGHAIRVHETGSCDGTFDSAGGVFNPFGALHGLLNPEGPMAGDLPNIFADASGTTEAELIAPHMQLSLEATESLLSEEARAIVVFEKPDDHTTEDGGSGRRIACGVIVKK
jgi:superoxide dismutase, Cu-Zn family